MSSSLTDGIRHYFGNASASQSTSDAKLAFLRAANGTTTGSLADNERTYFANLSGLTSPQKFSVKDHELKYLQTSLVSTNTDLSRLEQQKFV